MHRRLGAVLALALGLFLLAPAWAADVSITAANLLPDATTAQYQVAPAGAAVTAGQLVYLDTTGKWQLAKANGTAAQATLVGVATSTGVANQPLVVQISGNVNPGGTLVQGLYYIASPNNPGGLAPITDFTTSGHYLSIIGQATTTTNLQIKIVNTGVTHG